MTAEGFCRICTNSYVYSAIVEGGVELQACRSSAASLPLSSFSHWNERNNHGDDNATIVCQLGGQRVPQQLIRTTRRNYIRVSRHQLTAMLQSKSPWSKSNSLCRAGASTADRRPITPQTHQYRLMITGGRCLSILNTQAKRRIKIVSACNCNLQEEVEDTTHYIDLDIMYYVMCMNLPEYLPMVRWYTTKHTKYQKREKITFIISHCIRHWAGNNNSTICRLSEANC